MAAAALVICAISISSILIGMVVLELVRGAGRGSEQPLRFAKTAGLVVYG